MKHGQKFRKNVLNWEINNSGLIQIFVFAYLLSFVFTKVHRVCVVATQIFSESALSLSRVGRSVEKRPRSGWGLRRRGLHE